MNLWQTFWKSKPGRYTFNVLVGLDQLGNTLLAGDPDETISSRLGKLKKKHGGKIKWSRPLAKTIDCLLEVIDPGHSIDAIEYDEGKNALADKLEVICPNCKNMTNIIKVKDLYDCQTCGFSWSQR